MKNEEFITIDKIKKVKKITEFLNVKFSFYSLQKIPKKYINAYEISNNLIYLYPLNDGMPTCSFKFYKNGELIIDNNNEYSQISNLDDIILQMVRVYDKALDNKIIINPYRFMLELTDEIKKDYHGNAMLVITEKTIRNQQLNDKDFNEENKYFINRFLDHFIGWNFGVSVNRNNELKKELELLNEKVIDMGIREYAGTGFEVYGTEKEAHKGLQHYKLPTEKANVKKKTLSII